MSKVFILFAASMLLTTCAHSWVAVPQGVPDYKECKEGKSGPHMLSVPGLERTFIIVEECSTVDRERVSVAIKIFLSEWSKVFKDDTSKHIAEMALNDLVISFDGKNKTANAYTINGVYGEGFSLSGVTLSPGWVWVKATNGDRICNTSLAHELAHVIIWSTNQEHGDPDHLGDKYDGWTVYHNLVIQTTNELLCELGI